MFLQGCGAPKQTILMPTPALYEGNATGIFSSAMSSPPKTGIDVFYASGRGSVDSESNLPFNNNVDDKIHLGMASVRFGEGDMDWPTLARVSTQSEREKPVPLNLEKTFPMAVIPKVNVPDDPDSFTPTPPPTLTTDTQVYFDAINKQLAESEKKEIIIYVHGTKVDFLNAVTLAAEIQHFTARQFVAFAYDWPSHQNIFEYVIGVDKNRAINASYQLKNTLQLLAEHTDAKKINIVCYSAGGRVTSRALHQLRQDHAGMDATALKAHFRIGSVIFAAADVEVDRFLTRLEDISSIADQTVITVSDADEVLENARKLMRGQSRVGSTDAEAQERDFIGKHHLLNVHIVDVSRHKELRGFDIEGHHYWYRHPWMSSDIVFLLEYGMPPQERALIRSEENGIWYFGPDYPSAVKEATRRIAGSGNSARLSTPVYGEPE